MAVVEQTVIDPGQDIPDDFYGRIELVTSLPSAMKVQGHVPSLDKSIVDHKILELDDTGSWSLDMVPNELIIPAGTVYRLITVAHGHTWVAYFEVGLSGGRIEDLLVPDPTQSLLPPFIVTTNEIADGTILNEDISPDAHIDPAKIDDIVITDELDGAILAHVTADPAHMATSIAVEPAIGIVGDNVQEVLEELALGGGGGGSYDPNAVCVLRITGQLASHVNHGDFWPLGIDLGHFWWDAWIAPKQNDPISPNPGYLVSDGAGGDHSLLWGFEVGAGNLMIPTGNVYPNTHPLITFGSDDGVAQGEWAYHAVGWDGSFIYYFIDGILTGKVPFVGPRRAGYGQLFVGGSDHNQWAGDLAQLRAFEDCFPLGGPLYGFVPERYFSSGDSAGPPHTASFLANYMIPGQLTIPDLSDGYTGRLHPGQLNAAPYTIPGHGAFGGGAVQGIQQIPGRPSWIVSDTAPFDVELAHDPTGQIDAVPAIPVGSKVYDSFNRAKVNLTHLTPLLGSSDGGSLGPLAWQTGQSAGVTGPYASPWGIINGRAVSLMGGAAAHAAWVVTDSPNADVRVNRRSSASFGTHDTGLAMRVQDASHLYAIYTIGEPIAATHVYVVVNNGGTLSAPISFACPLTAWTTLRATFIGTTLTVYVDNLAGGWTQIGQISGLTAYQTATGFGLANYLLSTACRFDDFKVFA